MRINAILIIAVFLGIFCTTPERDNPFDTQSSTYGPPLVVAQRDTVVDINDTVKISANAIDNRGIDKLIWYGAFNDTCDTNFISVSFSDTGKDTLYVIAIDIDGVESREDTVIITVTQGLPVITKINDTILSETVNLNVNVKAYDTNKSGKIVKYLWDVGGDGWNDSTSDSTYILSSSIGDTTAIVVGVLDDDFILVTDTFNVIFNRVPVNASFIYDSTWFEFDVMTRLGKLLCVASANDLDGSEDLLMYELLLSEDSTTWKIAYAGDSTNFTIENIEAEKMYYYNLKVKDNFGDSLQLFGILESPDGPPIPDGMVFISAKDSSFLMGSTSGSYNEKPVHVVSFTHNFWIDTAEVTQQNYENVFNDNSFGYNEFTKPNWNDSYGVGDSVPAYFVNWYDAVLYCNILSKINGYDTIYTYSSITGTPGNDCELSDIEIDYTKIGYRLPTEAEWEYACRASDTTKYFWGSTTTEIDDYVWFGSNSDYLIHGIALKKPNNFGIYDICGNLWEWCNDNYDEYTSDTLTDPTGPESGSYRLKRGGAYNLSSNYLRSAVRNSSAPYSADAYIGFRVVLPE